MTDSLRDRIAAVLNESYPPGRYARYNETVARDIIRELGLTQERMEHPHSDNRETRYVTRWEDA